MTTIVDARGLTRHFRVRDGARRRTEAFVAEVVAR